MAIDLWKIANCEKRIIDEVNRVATSLGKSLTTMLDDETLIATIDSPVPPVQLVKPLIPPLDPGCS